MKKFFRHVAKAALLSLVFFSVCAAYSDPIVTRFFISSGFIKLAGNPTGTWEPSRIPAFAGGDCTSSAGTVFLTCAPFGRLASANTWASQQTFNAAPIFSTLIAYLKGNGSGALAAVASIPNTDITGLGTASTYAVGVSGATVPLLNGNVTFSGNATFSGSVSLTGTATAVTPATGDNSNAIETSAGVNAKISAVAGRQLLASLSCNSTTTCATALADTTHLTSTYSSYDLIIKGCTGNSTSAGLLMQLYIGGGYKTTGYNNSYYTNFSGTNAIGGASFTTGIPVIWLSNTTVPSESYLHFSDPSANQVMMVGGDGSTFNGANTSTYGVKYYGTYGTTPPGAVTGFQLVPMTAGTVTGCTIKLYGSI